MSNEIKIDKLTRETKLYCKETEIEYEIETISRTFVCICGFLKKYREIDLNRYFTITPPKRKVKKTLYQIIYKLPDSVRYETSLDLYESVNHFKKINTFTTFCKLGTAYEIEEEQ